MFQLIRLLLMNKKIIIFNLLLLMFLYVIAEYISYRINLNNESAVNSPTVNNNGFWSNTLLLPVNNFRKYDKIAEIEEGRDYRISFRKTIYDGTDNDKRAVILYGCSFTNGVFLENDENFSGQIRKLTKRLVYNRGLSGYGIQHSLFHIENNLKVLLSKHNNNGYPKYVIYTFIEDHINRLYHTNDYFDNWLMYYKYDKEQNKLTEISDFDIAFWHSYILRTLYLKSKADSTDFNSENGKYARKLVLDMFIQMKQSLKEQIEDVDFTVFVYDGDIHIKAIEQELKSNEINVVYLSEISKEDFKKQKYRIENDQHPNALAWKVITPLLVKKLNL